MLINIKSALKTTRFKTTLWYSGLFILLEVVFGFLIYTNLRKNLYDDLDEALAKEAQSIYKFVTADVGGLKNFQSDSIYSTRKDFIYNLIWDAIELHPRDSYIQIKLDDNLVYLSNNMRGHIINLNIIRDNQLSMVNFKDSLLSNYELRAARLQNNTAEIVVAVPTILIAKTLQHIVNLNLFLLPLFFFLALIGGATISAKSLSRIGSIIKKTREITAQNLNEIIPGGEFDDEYGRLVRTMNEMIMRIKTGVDFINQFSASVSHELKTPLTILQGEIEVALRSPKPAEEYKKILQSNYEETLYLTSIIDKLFFLSKIDHAELKLRKETVEIIKLIRPVINNMRASAKKKNIKFKLDINNKLSLLLDVDLMRRAISNLVENAIKYGYNNTSIGISVNLDKLNHVVISVSNEGRTIPKDLHIKIFDRFYRSETSRSREPGGMGLGLSIAKSIVEYHDGKIWVESEPGKDTIFSILLDQKET